MDKPPRVPSRYDYWSDPPPQPSERLKYWEARIRDEGWRPNARIMGMGYDSTTEWFGVYMWEYLNILWPLLRELDADA